jgi:hypothetical protein
MHTIIVIGIGLVLLAAGILIGHVVGGSAVARAPLWFVPLWLLGAALNMYVGVRNAGYAVSEEVPVFLVVFAIPALTALLSWWKLSRP